MEQSQNFTATQLDRLFNQPVQKQFYIESYGCQMNLSDSEIVASILSKEGFHQTQDPLKADLVFLNTCSIREKAEETIRRRLKELRGMKRQRRHLTIGILGCMAERLKSNLLEQEKLVDLVVGPDAYRELPTLLASVDEGNRAINVLLSREETYSDIAPVRMEQNGVTAFISIMRGCDNMCSFCVVPFTRGRERSRDPFSILAEAQDIAAQGYKEITLLGQNVDSYKWTDPEDGTLYNFAKLLQFVAEVDAQVRIRFSTSHPKDITDEVLHTIAANHNICKYIHLPVQSGSSRILGLMNRTYDRNWYQERVDAIRRIIPDCAISSDIITGFCTETEEDHQDTLTMMQYARYTLSYMFAYSERPGTPAAKKLKDDVPEEVKKQRLAEVIEMQHHISRIENQKDIGHRFEILVEGPSRKNPSNWKGRTSQNKVVVFPYQEGIQVGDYLWTKIHSATNATLIGEVVRQNQLIPS